MSHLNMLQKWMQGIITTPNGTPINRHSAHKSWTVETLISPSKTLTGHERMNIYNRSYFTRLLDCFKSEYSGLLHAIGDELFNHFVQSYLQKYPSTSYTLNDLGDKFPDFLQATLNENLNDQAPDSWQLFIIDIAKYEHMFSTVFNGHGHEELMDNNFFSTAALKISPALKTLQLNFPIEAYIQKLKQGEPNDLEELKPTNYVFTRHDYVVKTHKMEDEAFHALQQWINSPSQKCPIEHQTHWKIKRICY